MHKNKMYVKTVKKKKQKKKKKKKKKNATQKQLSRILETLQSNFNGSNIFGTMEICSRDG